MTTFPVIDPIETTVGRRRKKPAEVQQPPAETETPLWLSVSEAAKVSGVGTKTIRRAIDAAAVKFKVVGNRYLVNFASLAAYLFSATKLRNKFNRSGIGQYVDKWKS